MPPPSDQTSAPRHWGLLLALALAVGLTLRAVAFCGYYGSDDAQYAWLAHRLAQGFSPLAGYGGPPVFPLRLGLILPVAGLFRLLGEGELALVAYPAALSVASIALGAALARLLYGPRAGLLAAALLAVLPSEAMLATLCFPDVPAAFWAALGVLFLMRGARASGSARRATWGAAAGLAFFASWTCKETVFYLVPFALGYAIVQLRRDRRQLALLLGLSLAAALLLLGESAWYAAHTGDWLYRLHATQRNLVATSEWFFVEGSPSGWQAGQLAEALMRRLFVVGPRDILLNGQLAFLPAVALLAAIHARVRRLPGSAAATAWLLSLLVLYNFGSTSLSQYSPIVPHTRHLYLLVMAAAVVTAGWLASLIGPFAEGDAQVGRERRFWGVAVMAGMALAALVGQLEINRASPASQLERALAGDVRPDMPVLTDPRTAATLRFFWGFPEHDRVTDFAGLSADQVAPGSLVLLNPARARFISQAYGYRLPSFFDDVPRSWVSLWSGYGGILYGVR